MANRIKHPLAVELEIGCNLEGFFLNTVTLTRNENVMEQAEPGENAADSSNDHLLSKCLKPTMP